MDTDTELESIDHDTRASIDATIDALPERLTSAQLAAVVGVNVRRLERERVRGAVPPSTCKVGRCKGYERERVRGWIADRLAAADAIDRRERADLGYLIASYGESHVSDYYIHGHAPYMFPVVFKPSPEVWPVLSTDTGTDNEAATAA